MCDDNINREYVKGLSNAFKTGLFDGTYQCDTIGILLKYIEKLETDKKDLLLEMQQISNAYTRRIRRIRNDILDISSDVGTMDCLIEQVIDNEINEIK